VARQGYYFASACFSDEICRKLEAEVETLNLEEGDHLTYPINAGTSREVRQLHARAYLPIGHVDIPIANLVTQALIQEVQALTKFYPELKSWGPTEAGYQCYRDSRDWISPHRDRRTDQLLSATLTINGSALVRIHEPVANPDDYSNLKLVDEFLTSPGSVMLLRAPGLGCGTQIIHEVLPPISGSRLILNLRMRPNILKPPSEFLPTV
jgi:hypothetical protein